MVSGETAMLLQLQLERPGTFSELRLTESLSFLQHSYRTALTEAAKTQGLLWVQERNSTQ